MTRLPDDQDKLTAFLQEYRPLPPATLEILPEDFKVKLSDRHFTSSSRWLMPTAIAASLMLVWGVERVWLMKTKTLDQFVMESWHEAIQTDWQFSFLDP